jgi:hypothetical protein
MTGRIQVDNDHDMMAVVNKHNDPELVHITARALTIEIQLHMAP